MPNHNITTSPFRDDESFADPTDRQTVRDRLNVALFGAILDNREPQAPEGMHRIAYLEEYAKRLTGLGIDHLPERHVSEILLEDANTSLDRDDNTGKPMHPSARGTLEAARQWHLDVLDAWREKDEMDGL